MINLQLKVRVKFSRKSTLGMLLVVIPLGLGLLIYLFKPTVAQISLQAGESSFIPFLIYQVPDGLWALAFTSLLGLIWIDTPMHQLLAVLLLSSTLGPLWELYQYVSYASVTYDLNDCLTTLSFGLVGLLFILAIRMWEL